MKKTLSIAELDAQTAFELPERNLMSVAIGTGGLVGVGVAIGNVRVNDVIDVNNNNICVSVAAVGAAAGCDQDQ